MGRFSRECRVSEIAEGAESVIHCDNDGSLLRERDRTSATLEKIRIIAVLEERSGSGAKLSAVDPHHDGTALRRFRSSPHIHEQTVFALHLD
jgi:hypothetical protein